MSLPAISSSLEAANWFFRRADKDDHYLENDKLHQLLFLAQVHFALNNNMEYLIPSLFVCDERGFFEPNLAKILNYGMPLMEAPTFAEKINSFLELIWQKYSPMNCQELADFIKNSDSYLDNYQTGKKNIVALEDMAQKFKSSLNPRSFSKAGASGNRKILISQNGPVMVSAWQPRKLGSKNNKETKHA